MLYVGKWSSSQTGHVELVAETAEKLISCAALFTPSALRAFNSLADGMHSRTIAYFRQQGKTVELVS